MASRNEKNRRNVVRFGRVHDNATRRFVRAGILVTVVLGLLVSWGSPAWSKVYIDIDAPAFQRFPIAVQDFKTLDENGDPKEEGEWFADEMGRMLDITGFFRVIERSAFLEDPAGAGIIAPEIRFGDWLSIGVDFLVKGGLEIEDGRLAVEFRLFDVVRGALITGKRYWGRPEDKKTMVMKFAEEVMLALTGERGVFNTRIAFVGKKDNKSELVMIDYDGSGWTRLTDYGALTLFPRWSPDGKMIAFLSYMRGNPDAYILDLESRERTVFAEYAGLNMPSSWSPDGKEILCVFSKDGYDDIYAVNVATKQTRRITRSPSIDVSPRWSPDASEIVFVSNRSGAPHLFIMDADGGNVRRITFEGSYNTSPRWSPTGDAIVFESSVDGRFQLFTIEPDGSNFKQLTFQNGDCLSPSWSPDGRYIAFSLRRSNSEKICIINANGLNFRTIEDIGGFDSVKQPSWSPALKLY